MPIVLKKAARPAPLPTPASPPCLPDVASPTPPLQRPAQAARARGQRAGLTREAVLKHCRDALMAGETVSITSVAKACNVAPNAIYSRFQNGMASIELELAREMMAPLGRPAAPKESSNEYLWSLFSEADEIARASPGIARLLPPALASDPDICPRVEERILFCLTAAGVPNARRGMLMFWVVATLSCVFGLATSASDRGPRDRRLSPGRYASRIKEFPRPEFPMLHEHASLLDAALIDSAGRGARRGAAATFAAYVLLVVADEAQRDTMASS